MPRRSIPSISGLIAFEATARHRSFSQAARDLDLSQGAVSKRVRQLEEVLGVALFARDRQHVELTPAGRNYLAGVSRILAQLEVAGEALDPQPPPGCMLSVAVSPGLAAHWLIPKLDGFNRLHPGITVNLVTRTGAVDLVRDGLDATIMARPGACRGTTEVVLFEERLLPMASPSLVRRFDLAPAGRIAAAPRLQLAGRPDLWPDWFARAGLACPAPEVGPTHDSMALLYAAALAGHGIALLPSYMIGPAVRSGQLAPVSPTGLLSGREIVLDMPRRRRDLRAAGAFRRWVTAEGLLDHGEAGLRPPHKMSEAYSIK